MYCLTGKTMVHYNNRVLVTTINFFLDAIKNILNTEGKVVDMRF